MLFDELFFQHKNFTSREYERRKYKKSAENAIWWADVTITTVGYGDKFPVTTEGRLIAVVLMTAGVGLFGTFTAYEVLLVC